MSRKSLVSHPSFKTTRPSAGRIVCELRANNNAALRSATVTKLDQRFPKLLVRALSFYPTEAPYTAVGMFQQTAIEARDWTEVRRLHREACVKQLTAVQWLPQLVANRCILILPHELDRPEYTVAAYRPLVYYTSDRAEFEMLLAEVVLLGMTQAGHFTF